MYSHRNQHETCTRIHRGGFTLVEMLVALALVMLMMSMFATIFQMATGSATKQRIIAESDQRSRQLTTILRADFAKRSFRNTFPFLPNEDPTQTRVPFAARTGYIYISCNNVPSVQDDIIQFTVDARQVQTNPDDSRFYGASALLFDGIYGTIDGTNPSLPYNHNQPEADDAELVQNGTSSSDAAEISLFLRGGNLIRRIMLIREPLPFAGDDLLTQPMSVYGNPYFLTTATSQSGSGLPEFYLAANPLVPQNDFWRYFDFSAVPTNMADIPNGVTFLGIDDLSNEGPATTASFGRPNFRFGFNPVTGLSREHEGIAAGASFMGRYLQAETSANFLSVPQPTGPNQNEDFNWPCQSSSIGNPNDVLNPVTLNAATGNLNEFDGPLGRGGVRRVEDVLMSNVREFKIELWDSRLERWVVPGHTSVRGYTDGGIFYSVAGDYHIWRNAQYDTLDNAITYGPLQIPGALPAVTLRVPHVFDTWHPQITRFANSNGIDNDLSEIQPPYMPLKYYPPRQNDTPMGPSSPNMPALASEFDPNAPIDPLYPGSGPRVGTNRGYWTLGTEYYKNDVVFAVNPGVINGWDFDNDGFFDWNNDQNGIPVQSVHTAYRCIGSTNGPQPPGTPLGTSGGGVPPWQSPDLAFLDNDLVWQGFQNYQPLKSVRLTVSFIEPNSETPKQLTLVLPLTDAAQ